MPSLEAMNVDIKAFLSRSLPQVVSIIKLSLKSAQPPSQHRFSWDESLPGKHAIKCSAKLINFVKRELSMQEKWERKATWVLEMTYEFRGRWKSTVHTSTNVHTWHIFLPFCDSGGSNLLAVCEKYEKTFHINGRSGWNVFFPLFLGLEAWWKLVRYCGDVCMEQY